MIDFIKILLQFGSFRIHFIKIQLSFIILKIIPEKLKLNQDTFTQKHHKYRQILRYLRNIKFL